MIRKIYQPALFLLLMLISPFLHSQEMHTVSGKVIDSKSKEPLAFVNIVINNSLSGGTTDIDGKFHLSCPQEIRFLKLSYVGYISQKIQISGKTTGLVIELVHTELELKEVEILPGINPAHRIIRNAIEYRDMNDPEKLQSFSYTAYDKTIFTIEKDSLHHDSAVRKSGVSIEFSEKKDTLRADTGKIDSTDIRIADFLNKQNLFLMENVTRRKFMAPDRSVNDVIATRMSGFKDPIFVFLTTQIQSFSFYKPFITIFQSSYVNPISNGSLGKYFFKIEDTTYSGNDTVFIISFRPRKGTNFDGMKGVISINTNRWAIQNVIAGPADPSGGIRIRIQQMYEFLDNQAWFPVQLNTDVYFEMMSAGSYKVVAKGRNYIRDIVLNPEMVRREFNKLDIEVDKMATKRDENFWNQYRTDSLTIKDRRTYETLDSIGKAENFDRYAKGFKTILQGKIPYKYIEFDLNKLAGYNEYEGLILGLGIHTSDRFSKRLKFGGFYQYAFAIVTSKYGGDIFYLANRRNDIALRTSWSYNLTPSGTQSFFDDYESVLLGNFASLFYKKLDRTENASASMTFRLRKYWLFSAGLSRSFKKSTSYDLSSQENNVMLLENQFVFSNFIAGVKWAYKEKFLQTIDEKISLGTKYPVVWLQYTRGIKGFLNGDYDYNKFDLKISKTFNFKYLGKLNVTAAAGYVDNPIPATDLYYGTASYGKISLYAPNSFSVMRQNEFLSSKFVSLYLYHNFGYMLYKGKNWFHPEFAIAQNTGIGWLDHPDRYTAISLEPKTMNLGYYESGILINNLVNLSLYNIGIGAFYRYGPYSFDKTIDNFSFKVSIGFNLKF